MKPSESTAQFRAFCLELVTEAIQWPTTRPSEGPFIDEPVMTVIIDGEVL